MNIVNFYRIIWNSYTLIEKKLKISDQGSKITRNIKGQNAKKKIHFMLKIENKNK